MSAAVALQAALVAAVTARAGLGDVLTGIFDGPPPRVAFPYAAIGSAVSSDWGYKGGRGREHRLSVTIWDDGEEILRLQALLGEAELAIEGIDPALDGHRLVSLTFLRNRILRTGAGPYNGIVEYRARTLEA